GVERRAGRRVGATSARQDVARRLDGGEIGLEGDPLKVVPLRDGTGEQGRGGMQRPILGDVGVGPWPGVGIRGAVEVSTEGDGRLAATDLDQCGLRAVEAPVVVRVQTTTPCVSATSNEAIACRNAIGLVAVLEMPDLIGEGDIVRVGSPWDARALARG